MKLLMDSDCLIKLTKAGLKDLIGSKDIIFIPEIVQREVVEAGKEKDCADALMVEKNIEAHVVKVAEASSDYTRGDEALLKHFKRKEYDAVATDDAKLTRFLKVNDIPVILPALIIYHLFQDGIIDKKTALSALKQLAKFISDDEYSTVRLLMEERK